MIDKIHSENIKLQSNINKLQARLSSIENISRSYNVELQSVPETKSENLMHIFKQLCTTIGSIIADNDVISCRRVAKFDPQLSRPRNILISLSSPRLRDSIISLASRFNKTRTNDEKLNTPHLGLTGATSRIYVTEHISPECKQLYNDAKKLKDLKQYKYSYVLGEVQPCVCTQR